MHVILHGNLRTHQLTSVGVANCLNVMLIFRFESVSIWGGLSSNIVGFDVDLQTFFSQCTSLRLEMTQLVCPPLQGLRTFMRETKHISFLVQLLKYLQGNSNKTLTEDFV